MLSPAFNRSSRARSAIPVVPITRRFVDRLVAGETIPEAVAASKRLERTGRLITVNVLAGDVTDLAGARATRDTYLALLYALSEAGCAHVADVSIKLSALGEARIDEMAAKHAYQICVAAAAVNSTVTLDMEDHTTVDSTLAIATELRREFREVAVVLQSHLKRTPDDLAQLERSGARVRLVKGAYSEPASVAYQRKTDVDRAYRADIEALMGSSCYPMIATHDPRMIAIATSAARQHKRSAEAWELQMLYGLRADLQERAVEERQQLRVYVPFGTDWYGYFMRRLVERPANIAFFLRALARGR